METMLEINRLALLIRLTAGCFLFGLALSGGTSGTVKVALNWYYDRDRKDCSIGIKIVQCTRDLHFEIVLATIEWKILRTVRTRVYYNTTSIYFTKDLGNNLENPITFEVPEDVLTSVNLRVNLYVYQKNAHLPELGYQRDFTVMLEPGFNKFGANFGTNKNPVIKISYGYHGPPRTAPCISQTNYICGKEGNKICNPGYTDPTKNCETVHNCHKKCGKNYQYCFIRGKKPICYCKPGFKGKRCEVISCDPSSLGSCKNGGTCVRQNNGFVCKCSPRYSGNFCENPPCSDTDPQAKDDPSCSSDAYVCEHTLNKKYFSCSCKPGHAIKYGECEPILHCQPNPCVNGGTCKVKNNDFKCNCPHGFGGKRCQKSNDRCRPNPCESGNKCLNTPDSYDCVPNDST